MRYLDYRKIGGRLGNQLYFCLQAYSQTHNRTPTCYCLNNTAKHFNLKPILVDLGMADLICDEILYDADDVFVLQTPNYMQKVDVDFSYQMCLRFIHDTILKSNSFNRYCLQYGNGIKDRCAIQIRNGDYLSLPQFNCFDRKKYLEKCLSYINVDRTPHKCKSCTIVSDDVENACLNMTAR